MCLLLILAFLILLLLILFVKSAVILLPWTLSAMVLGGLSGIALGKLTTQSNRKGILIGVVSSMILTLTFGLAFYYLAPPKPPPPNEGWEVLLETPEPTQEDLQKMFPIHLGIVSVLGAIFVSASWYRWSPATTPKLEPKADKANSGSEQQR